ncbi:sclerostin domain-containing protein 1-like isoform X1 [Octopus sinensis]|nr:sclerostin domain-containing protein 1-like isoform X1 [Octopus sinensis]
MGDKGTLLPALFTMLLALVAGTKEYRAANKTLRHSPMTTTTTTTASTRIGARGNNASVLGLSEPATTSQPEHVHAPNYIYHGGVLIDYNVFYNMTYGQNTSIEPTWSSPYRDDIQMGCKELRSKKYISDGSCTSIKPVMEMICTGYCLPIDKLPWYAEYVKYWSRTKILEWRCVEERIRRKEVPLLCNDGQIKYYNIKVVKSCTCKRYHANENRSDYKIKYKTSRKSRRHRKRGRRTKSRKNRKNKTLRKTN